ncbi:MAG: hypothetical protein EAZ37_09205 [Burkholderiales bacterium]|nr:MAG: hypothetical protein EAZ37_09205 [Burkholderiales bacterium]
MTHLNRFPQLLCGIALALFLPITGAFAQEANVLGLPAVPQPKPGAAAASAPKPAPGISPNSSANRDVLAGEMGLQHSALGGLGRLVITTRATFTTAGAKSSALDAAKSVQRDLAKACGKQCKPEKMAAPKILPSGQLEFDLSFRPLYQHLNQAQFLAALQSKPLNLTPEQLTAPAAAAPEITGSASASATASK